MHERCASIRSFSTACCLSRQANCVTDVKLEVLPLTVVFPLPLSLCATFLSSISPSSSASYRSRVHAYIASGVADIAGDVDYFLPVGTIINRTATIPRRSRTVHVSLAHSFPAWPEEKARARVYVYIRVWHVCAYKVQQGYISDPEEPFSSGFSRVWVSRTCKSSGRVCTSDANCAFRRETGARATSKNEPRFSFSSFSFFLFFFFPGVV